MADVKPNEPTDNEQRPVMPSVVSYIPADLKNDPWVRSIAVRCDELQRDVQRERDDHKETRTGLYDALDRGLRQAIELEKAKAVIAKRDHLVAIWPSVYWLAVVALIAIVGTIQVVWG